MNMRLEIHINYIPSIIHLSEIHSSIRNNKHYHGIYQNRVEMVIVFSLKVILTYNSWVFKLETFWYWRIDHIELITQGKIPPWAWICKENWKWLRGSAAIEEPTSCPVAYTCNYNSIKAPWKTWVASPNTNLDGNLSPSKLAKERKLVIH